MDGGCLWRPCRAIATARLAPRPPPPPKRCRIRDYCSGDCCSDAGPGIAGHGPTRHVTVIYVPNLEQAHSTIHHERGFRNPVPSRSTTDSDRDPDPRSITADSELQPAGQPCKRSPSGPAAKRHERRGIRASNRPARARARAPGSESQGSPGGRILPRAGPSGLGCVCLGVQSSQ